MVFNEKLFSAEERDARPIDELGEILLGVDQRVVFLLQIVVKTGTACAPILNALIASALRKEWVIESGRVKFMKSVLRVRANVVKEVIRVPARRIRADQRLAAVVEQGRFDALFPVRHHGIFGSVVAVFGEGGLVNHDALIPPTATNNRILQRPEIEAAAIGEADGRRRQTKEAGTDMLSLTSPRHISTHMGTFGSSGFDSVAHVQNSRIVSVSKSEPDCAIWSFLARSNSHSVAVRDGRTRNTPACGGQELRRTTPFSPLGFLGHVGVRFVHLDPPELIKSWKI